MIDTSKGLLGEVNLNALMPLMENISSHSVWNSAIAGYAAGSCGVVFGHPLDSMKVWIQSNTMGQNKHLHASLSLGRAAGNASATSLKAPGLLASSKNRISTRGIFSSPFLFNTARRTTSTIKAVYSGIGVPLVTVGAVQSINFATYDAVKHTGANFLGNDSLAACGIAGFVSGSVVAFITSPFLIVKCRQQITGISFRQACQDSLVGADGRISVRRCFVGFGPHYVGESFGRACYYTVYEWCKKSILAWKKEEGIQVNLTLGDRMKSGAIAGMLCWALIFPVDTLRSRIYSQSGPERLSTIEMARTIGREGAFYRGFWVTILRAGPVAAAVLPVYDLTLEKLSSRC